MSTGENDTQLVSYTIMPSIALDLYMHHQKCNDTRRYTIFYTTLTAAPVHFMLRS